MELKQIHLKEGIIRLIIHINSILMGIKRCIELFNFIMEKGYQFEGTSKSTRNLHGDELGTLPEKT
ncbi:MAG TPA: hypothetical protein VMC48_03315 [Methanobacterium sp.]|nr:hypothetical protein [Methanobacterium sp.]